MEIPVNQAIIIAVSRLVDDSGPGVDRREPSHSALTSLIKKSGLTEFDPKHHGETVGKAKRVVSTLSGAEDVSPTAVGIFITRLLGTIHGHGGFRPGSACYVGAEAIANAKGVFDSEGFLLADDGNLQPKVLSALSGAELTIALRAYAVRAQKGSQDAALLTGTGKDLLEATAAHVVQTICKQHTANWRFRDLLGMAFTVLELSVPEEVESTKSEGSPIKQIERAMFEAACGVNRLRNKQGTGHGRPWPAEVSTSQAKLSIEIVGSVSAYLLAKLQARPA